MGDFKWRHFQGEVILWAVRWYCRDRVSYRDLEQMMGERGVAVDHSTIYRWVQKYAPEMTLVQGTRFKRISVFDATAMR
jgi:transposase, IS6 family